MSDMPSHNELSESIGQIFTLSTHTGLTVEAHLLSAPACVPMDDSFTCYSAHFELPPGVVLGQDVYRVVSPAGREWQLLATPVRPLKPQSQVMCVVIHTRLAVIAGGEASACSAGL